MKNKMKKVFTRGVDCFTQIDLFRKAAALKGLELKDVHGYFSDSRNIKEYFLTEDLLAKLAERGIKKSDLPAEPNFVVRLVDENIYIGPLEHFPANQWEFRRAIGQKFDLRIFLSVGFQRREVDDEVIGISLRSQANGTCSSASSKCAHFHLFKALAEDWVEAPAIVKELVASDGIIHLAWADLGLEGLCYRPDFFWKFVNGNKEVFELHKKKVFSPAPFPLEPKEGEALYDTKAIQCYLGCRWSKQLRAYRDSLTIKRRRKAIT
jgi:hypothetical protein